MRKWFRRFFIITDTLFDVYMLMNDVVAFFTTYKKKLEEAGIYNKAGKLIKRAELIRDNVKALLPKKRIK